MKYPSSVADEVDDLLKLSGLTSFLPRLSCGATGETLLYLLEARSPSSWSVLESSSLDSRRTDKGDLDEEIVCRCLEDDKDSGLGGFSKSDDDPFTIASICFRFRDGDGEFFVFPEELSSVA